MAKVIEFYVPRGFCLRMRFVGASRRKIVAFPLWSKKSGWCW